MKSIMTTKDVKAVNRAIATLEKLNKKYGQPHGTNPVGIIFYAYKSIKQEALTQADVDRRRAGLC